MRWIPLLLLLLGCPPGSKPTDDTGPVSVDADGDGFLEEHDCDDNDPAVHPGADEVCNSLDDDCDGYVDAEDPSLVGGSTFYVDADGDAYGDDATELTSCEQREGMVTQGGDCDDSDAAVHPGAAELCNDLDDDCDGLVDLDDPELVGAYETYVDADGDGFGDDASLRLSCDEPPVVVPGGDCDDGDAAVHPDADELCDGVDNDCDGDVDESGSVDAPIWYLDGDGDGYGISGSIVSACEQPSGYAAQAGDCDESDASIHPGADELCDGADNDCDGVTDEGDAVGAPLWYADADGDGYGDLASVRTACSQPTGYVAGPGDCDDGDGAINPAATEICDGVDNDCDGTVDLGVAGAPTWYSDADGDGYGDASAAITACSQPTGTVTDASDCDDSDSGVNPAATEVCDGVDNDCDGTIDVGATDPATWYTDGDGDGFGDPAAGVEVCTPPSGTVADNTDCDDGDASINPDADELCDGVDNDCDGTVDVDAVDESLWYGDVDGDGYGNAAAILSACTQPSGHIADSSDCDDGDAAVNPGATEVCNGVDDDCDGTVDVGAADEATWYADADGDGFGELATSVSACTQPSGHVADASDCDDAAAWIHPGADEYCNGDDDDCDGTVDVGALDEQDWYADADGDGFGDGSAVVATACSQPAGTVADSSDCDDGDASIHPGAAESCDGVDEDCDGIVDDGAPGSSDWYDDLDGDGYGDTSSAVWACSAPTGMITTGGDCDDSDATIHPGATEYCDGVDTDCDGTDDPAGVVTFVGAYGGKTDVTSTFTTMMSTTPNTYSFTSNGTLNFCSGSYSGLVEVSASSASIIGRHGSSVTDLSAWYAGSVISVLSGASELDVSGLTLREGAATNGGAVSSSIAGLDFSAEDLLVELSVATNYGGGIYMLDAASVSLTGLGFTECAAVRGGALYMEEGALLLDDTTFEFNAATSRGGAFCTKNVTGSASGLLVSENVSADDGGGFFIEGTVLVLSDSMVLTNTATDRGGGIYLKNGSTDLQMSTTLVEANLAVSGGGMFIDDSSAACTGATGSDEGFLGNLATTGGGIYLKGHNGGLEASDCDMGTGSDDNILGDVHVEKGGTTYSSYGDDADFDCDEDSCW